MAARGASATSSVGRGLVIGRLRVERAVDRLRAATPCPREGCVPAGERPLTDLVFRAMTPEAFIPDRRDWLRLAGGLLFAAGAVVLLLRKQDDWGNWAQFLVVLVPTVVLYGAAVAGARVLPALQGWESAFYTFAIILLPLTLLALVGAIDNDADGSLNAFWVFGVSAAVAALTALRRGAWWQMLIGGIWAIVSWLSLWDKILDNPSATTIRWLLIALAALFL